MDTPQQHWRMFIAIESPPQVKEALKRAQASLRTTVPDSAIRWTQPNQFHLTLKFLGNIPEPQADTLASRLTDACRAFGSLQLRAEGIGFFPNARCPRVIWAGVKDANYRLRKLSELVTAATEEFSPEEREKEFHGHITLGRVKYLSRSEVARLTDAPQGAPKFFGEWEADRIWLIRSELSPSGPIYTTVAEPRLV